MQDLVEWEVPECARIMSHLCNSMTPRYLAAREVSSHPARTPWFRTDTNWIRHQTRLAVPRLLPIYNGLLTSEGQTGISGRSAKLDQKSWMCSRCNPSSLLRFSGHISVQYRCMKVRTWQYLISTVRAALCQAWKRTKLTTAEFKQMFANLEHFGTSWTRPFLPIEFL